MKQIFRQIGWVFGLLGLSMLMASIASIWLARSMSPKDFGEFSLMRSLILFIPTLAIWGQDIAITTFFARTYPGRYRWFVVLRRVLIGSLIIGILATIVSGWIYHLKPYQLICLAFAVPASCSSLALASFFRAMGRYRFTVLMTSAFRGLFLIVVTVLWVTERLDIQSAVIGYTLTLAVTAVINFFLAYKFLPVGKEEVSPQLHRTGLIYMGIGLTVNILISLDALMISRVLGHEALALFSAAVVPAQMFAILSRAAKIVWVPEFGRNTRVRMNSYGRWVIICAFALMLTMTVAARPILHVLYHGKYDDGSLLLQLLAVAGMLRLVYGLSSSFIIGRCSERALIVHLVMTCTVLLLYVPGLYFALRTLGVLGAGYALLLQLLIRVGGSYTLIGYGEHRHKTWFGFEG
ncbi:oligosaccharide flippase family protein [candidate division KSB1 bacterium]|nr:oligosaccharide flippase family protein [candidate division KSB1 bacterium]